VHLKTGAYASVTVDIDADGLDAEEIREMAIEKAFEGNMPSLCHQCAGWRQGFSLELGDDWDVDGEGEDAVREVTP
jgi:hypothetical protein